MTPYISTITGNFGFCAFFQSVFLSCFSVPLPPPPWLSPFHSPLWCLGFIVRRAAWVLWVFCWHEIAETESEMTKLPFSCLRTTPAPTLTAVINLNLSFPERTEKRDEMKRWSRTRGRWGESWKIDRVDEMNQSGESPAAAQLSVQGCSALLEFRPPVRTYLLLSIK